jgi:hypothetical protein
MFATTFSIAGDRELEGSHISWEVSSHGLHAEVRKIGQTVQK